MDIHLQSSQSIGTRRLYEAALKGDVLCLHDLLKEDPLILDRCTITNSGYVLQSPLHVAANMGHIDFLLEILRQKPELAENNIDQSNRLSPLHVASAKGHLEVVQSLLKVNPSMCLERDQDGKSPIHLAAIKGQVDVLEALHQANPYAARERTNYGESILHLCVKFNQFWSLKAVLQLVDDDGELINTVDSDGNTVLHLAMAGAKFEMVELLLACPKLDKNAINKHGMTLVDIYKQSKKAKLGDRTSTTIEHTLKQAKALPAKDALNQQANSKWLEEQRSSLMVVASLIATMAFQVGINPPGGVWQDNQFDHEAGLSIMSYDSDSSRMKYDELLVSNTIGLTSSLGVIILLISGLPCKKFGLFILRTTLWISVTATAATYFISIGYLMKGTTDHIRLYREAFDYSIKSWVGVMGIILLGHIIRFILKKIGWRKKETILKLLPKKWHTMRSSPNKDISDDHL